MHTVVENGLAAAASELLAEVVADPWGSVSPSVYETGRLVAIAPWLAGHSARLEFLCRSQHADGTWGGPDGYAVVPTLSATAALLVELGRRPDRGPDPELDRAGQAGLAAVRRWLEPGGWLDPEARPAIPDTVAVELMVPALLAELAGLLAPSVRDSLRLPDGFDQRRLEAMRARLTTGPPPPEPVHHCLELLGPAAAAMPFVRPAEGGVGASAAATATWLGGAGGPPDSHEFLRRLQERGNGTVPNVTPISYFEAAWVLNSFAVGGLPYRAPAALLDRLDAGLTEFGAPAGPGLPTDADDTAGVLSALLRHGRSRSPEPLLGFLADGYFRCFPHERNPSVSTNAHVLEALSLYLARRTDPTDLSAVAAATAGWLCGQQQPDGSWWDKWHASPYYATACCVLALTLHGGPAAQAATDRAMIWVLDTQRPDGAWGRWQGSVEETSYAIQILAPARSAPAAAAITRGQRFLAELPPRPTAPGAGGEPAAGPALWHGKDLYTPTAVVRAARLAAQGLAAQGLARADAAHDRRRFAP